MIKTFWKRYFVFFIASICLVFLISINANAGETVVYSQGFESGNGGYTLNPDPSVVEWEWGTPSGSVGPGSAHSGSKCWGTNLDGILDHSTIKDGSIISPAIYLPPLTGDQVIRVRFWGYIAISGMYDRGEFFISKDGVNWESLCELFQAMDKSGNSQAGWRKYEFSVDSSYAGGNIYLRFRAYVPMVNTSFYCGGGTDLSGFYVDDVAITYSDVTGNRKVFSLEAWEDPSAYASCPWVAPWNGEAFEVDNDIYSVARTQANEYLDHYKLLNPLVEKNGVYPVEIQEREQEDSYTDYVALKVVDHSVDTSVAPDQNGSLHAFKPAELIAPAAATSGTGDDVLGLVSQKDDQGFQAYSDDTVTVTFDGLNASDSAILYLRVAGFILGTGDPKPYVGPPAIVVETRDDTTGQWVERGRLRPRFKYSVAAFDLSPYLSGSSIEVRLRSVSHATKYHTIDRVALFNGQEPEFSSAVVSPSRAIFGTQDIQQVVSLADGSYFKMSTGEKYSLEFPVPTLQDGLQREFIFISKGYYIPKSGTYLIYTWDGSDWVLRDAYSYPGSDYTRQFDLSLFLPDPDGEYKIRVWQDYQYEPAGIDYVKMMVGSNEAVLLDAYDYRANADITDIVKYSDDTKTYWTYCPRDRITEYEFEPPTSNVPPTTKPVVVTDLSSDTPTINWTYYDNEGSPQSEYEVEVWTGAGATGTIMWDPTVGIGTNVSAVYAGTSLIPGVPYYARVRANDGADWGQWSETEFTIEQQICGDLDHDGDVDGADRNILRYALNTRTGDPGFVAEADYDGDGLISYHDYQQWYVCYKAFISK